jgi:hypothetical protein
MQLQTWYYTFSTISQTLASIVGLSAVFVAIRLEQLDRTTSLFRERALNIIAGEGKAGLQFGKEAETHRVIKKLEHIINDFDHWNGDQNVKSIIIELITRYEPTKKYDNLSFIKDTHFYLDKAYEQKTKVINLIKWPAFFVAIAIGFSLIYLSTTDYLISLPGIINVLMLFVVFSLFSIFSIFRAIWKILFAIKVN